VRQRGVDHDRGGQAERAHIGQRVHLGAERARHAQLAGQGAVQPVEGHAGHQAGGRLPHVALHGQEDGQQAEGQAGQGAAVDQGEAQLAGRGLIAGEQRHGGRNRLAGLDRDDDVGQRRVGDDREGLDELRPGVDHLGPGGGGGAAGVCPGPAADPHQQGLPGEGAAAAQTACPTATGGTRTIRRTTPAPRGTRHVVPPWDRYAHQHFCGG
jgi:hypothetical protein